MNIKTIEILYSQEGPNLHYFTEYEHEYDTDRYSYDDPIFDRESLLKDFRKNDLSYGQDAVSGIELYLDDELVAILQPCYTIENETFNQWGDCYMSYDTDNSLMISDVSVTKRLNVIDRKKLLEIIEHNSMRHF